MPSKFVLFLYLVIFLVPSVHNEDIERDLKLAQFHPVSDFSRHTLVKPKIYHGREKRQISTTKEEDGQHIDQLQIVLEVRGEEIILDLTLNKQLIPKGFFHKHQENGGYKIHTLSNKEANLCDYSGKVRGKPDSWVALSTCEGISGVIFDGEELHYIEKDVPSSIESSHFMYKHSDLVEGNKTCGYEGDVDSASFHSHTDNRILRYKRDVEEIRVRGPYNANRESKYVELVLVIDNQGYKDLGESRHRVSNHAKNIANIINGLYSPLNIFIALVGVVMWTERDEIDLHPNGDTTLTNFLHYRREKLIKEHPNDNAQLLTKFTFNNGVVGKALKGPICTYEFSGGVNMDHSSVVGLVATTIAHEMGHNFGMEHDTNECKCPDDRCIMAPTSSTVATTHWSSCSLSYLLQAFTHGMDYCLKNKPQSLYDGPTCGNGFVEDGEECDCGEQHQCANACCDAATCKLRGHATCATGECCDLTTCQPRTAGVLCRSANYECDLPEYCTGESEYCPSDSYKLDTEVCDGGNAYCYSGLCRTRTDQCKLLWGETAQSSDGQCYKLNTKGNRNGNCGYNKLNQSYVRCEDESIFCGMLHCKHFNEKLEFGMESVAILSHSFLNSKGSIIPCRNALVDLGINQKDPGLTPDGAHCGEGKMCVNQKCMSVSNLRIQGPTCPQDCNGNGWCNNKGHCHCRDGFAPPYCDYPGPGGSLDSGPASDPNARRGLVIALFVIFLGIVPLITVVLLLVYYARRNFKFGWKKPSATTSKSPAKTRGPSSFPSEATRRTEDNHSLLREETPPPMGFSSAFFGNFKGFTISPTKEPEPLRAAPPPPTNQQSAPPKTKLPGSNIFNKPIQKYNSFRNGVSAVTNTSTAPALPPPNPGSHSRPIISSPVLENSTCTAKELVSPLRNAPKVPLRAAPEAPATDTHLTINIIEETKKTPKDGTLNRITSFLKSADKKPVIPVNKPTQVKATKVLNKDSLRSLEISSPILQSAIELPSKAGVCSSKPVVMRAQSMRATKETPRPNIQTFGSMRQPSGFKRPLSIPSGSRPKNPPPPRPPPTKSAELTQYDDCLNEETPAATAGDPNGSDNIYAVIEESPASPLSPVANNCSNDSMGLLGEIVTEIQNLNFDSIYSTSTLARKKKEAAARAERGQDKPVMSPDSSETYVNTSSLYPDSEYSNMSGNLKSSASSTSSGYILPSAVNIPVKKAESKAETEQSKPALSSFKTDSVKPFARPQGPLASSSKTNQPAVKKVETSPDRSKFKTPSPSKQPPKTINRQITPPNLRTRKPSPTRPSPPIHKSNRSVTNSPDLVTSCNGTPPSKPPDVLGGNSISKKPSVASTKPNVNLPRGPVKSKPVAVGAKTSQEKKNDVKATDNKLNRPGSNAKTAVGVRNAARSNSNVASLQQKFENKGGAASDGPKVKT